MKTIPLTQNRFALVDDEDFERLNEFRWHAYYQPKSKTWYASRRESVDFSGKLIKMHHDVLGLEGRVIIDHANRNGLDNQKRNLRPASRGENAINSKIFSHNKTGYRGVQKVRRNPKKPFAARIMVDQKEVWLGYHPTALEAHFARQKASIKYFGEFTPRD